MTVTMTYRDYSFSPIPLLNITKEFEKTEDGTVVGTRFAASLNGTLTPIPAAGGIDVIDDLQDELKNALAEEGHKFLVACDGTPLIQTYPRITNIEFQQSNNQWVLTCPYTVNMEWDDDPNNSGENSGIMPSYIASASEEWTLEFVEENSPFSWVIDGSTTDAMQPILRLGHSVSATGKRHYSASTGNDGALDMQAWEQARSYVVNRLGEDNSQVAQTGVLNLDVSQYGYFNHMRSTSVGELAGTYSVQENWVVFPSGASGVPGNALEDFSIEIRENADDGLIGVGVQGNIQGLESRSYGSASGEFNIGTYKYDSALAYWNVAKSRLYGRAAKAVENTEGSTRGLHITPLSKSVGHSLSNGTISYSYEYNDRPCNLISGARSENIEISDTFPTDVFAELSIPGRAFGPILQEISTVSLSTRSVNIDVVMEAPSGDCTDCTSKLSSMLALSNSPKTQVEELLCCLEGDLTGSYSQVFKTADSSTFSPKTGRYSRQVAWSFTNCSGDPPSTSFC